MAFYSIIYHLAILLSLHSSNNIQHNTKGNGIDSIISPGAVPILISAQFSFTEGPAVDKKGNIFFTDQPNDKIWKYDINGRLSIFLDKTGRSNGLCFDKKDRLIACADEKNELWRISKKGKITKLIESSTSNRLNGPNDAWVHPNGSIYFTDPYYERDYWQTKKTTIPAEKVYWLPKGKNTPVAVADDLQQPNGIAGTADGNYLYIADIRAGKTYRYSISKDGMLQEKKLFVNQGSDGMTLDNKGNVYLTGNGVTVYNPQGEKIQHIAIPEGWTSNVCFGGKNRDMLFITASKSVYTLAMRVKGIE